MNTAPADPDTLTTQQYQEAFQKIRDRLTDRQVAMLRTHYHAPNRKITASQMAEAVGYQSFAAANLQYGIVGGLLCELLGQELGSGRLFVLVHFIRPEAESNQEWLWQMREPAAEALCSLGWV